MKAKRLCHTCHMLEPAGRSRFCSTCLAIMRDGWSAGAILAEHRRLDLELLDALDRDDRRRAAVPVRVPS